jgi:hypothetical protein
LWQLSGFDSRNLQKLNIGNFCKGNGEHILEHVKNTGERIVNGEGGFKSMNAGHKL